MKTSAGRVLMLVENEFPRDTRVRNEAFTLAAAGLQVSVIALRGKGEKRREMVGGVSVHRIPRLTIFKKLPQEKRSPLAAFVNRVRILVGYVSEYLYFTTACLVVSCRIAVTEGIDVIHAHNPPDTLFIVGAVHKLFGRKFVFDHHDLCPELYRSRYATPNGLLTRGLALCERASVRVADVVVATNESYRAIDIERNGIAPERVFIVRNGPDLARVRLTDPDPELRGRAKVILGYLGAMNPQDGVDYLLRALDCLRHKLNRSDFHCIVIGDGDSLEELRRLAKDLRLDDCVTFTGFIPDKEMVRYLSTVDICLDPNPSSPLNDVSTWIKVMEYMALGKPVVSFDLKETRVSAGDAAAYVEPNNEEEFAKTIAALMDDPTKRARMAEVGRARVQHELGWHVTSRNLLLAYERLLQKPLVPVAEVRQFSGGTSS
jgi:glycosyltransferase involved in cell wall biosynthesis